MLVRPDPVDGWDRATPEGIEVEGAVRAAGSAIAARAESLAAPGLAEVNARWADRGVTDDDSYRAWMDAQIEQNQADRARAWADNDVPLFRKHAETYTTLAAELQRHGKGEGQFARERAAEYAKAYQKALAEQRSMGGAVTDLTLHYQSQKATTGRLAQVLPYYPTSWIQRSGAYTDDNGVPWPLLVRTQRGGRAYYAHNATGPVQITEPHVTFGTVLLPKGAAIPEGATKIKEVAAAELSDGSLTRLYEEAAAGKERNAVEVRVPRTETRTRIIKGRIGVLTVDTMVEGCLPAGQSTALHELGHRMEQVVPGVTDMERAFLARRTTDPTGRRVPLSNYLTGRSTKAPPRTAQAFASDRSTRAGTREWVREDGFAVPYIGKEYGPAASATEVLSVGMEAVFAGRYGGLRGGSGWKADLEHRDLVLGSLAVL